jgi:hypothetical protein
VNIFVDRNVSEHCAIVRFSFKFGEISDFLTKRNRFSPVTVAERSKTCTVFARSEAGIVGPNSTHGMDV